MTVNPKAQCATSPHGVKMFMIPSAAPTASPSIAIPIPTAHHRVKRLATGAFAPRANGARAGRPATRLQTRTIRNGTGTTAAAPAATSHRPVRTVGGLTVLMVIEPCIEVPPILNTSAPSMRDRHVRVVNRTALRSVIPSDDPRSTPLKVPAVDATSARVSKSQKSHNEDVLRIHDRERNAPNDGPSLGGLGSEVSVGALLSGDRLQVVTGTQGVPLGRRRLPSTPIDVPEGFGQVR